MSRIAQANASHSVFTTIIPRLGFWAHLRGHFALLNRASARQARFAKLNGEETRDLALAPEDIMGESAYDPALPFFLQAGFQQR